MKLVRFTKENDDNVYHGTLEGEKVHDEQGSSFSLSEVQLLAPTDPSKIICAALNYKDHAEESNEELPERPSLFFKPPSAVIGPGENIVLPDSERVDYEGEIGVVIGEECRDVSSEGAESVILGYTCFNDVSDRDNQFNEQNWVRGKGFDTSAPIGPVILTQGEVEGDLTITTRVNGEVKQNSDSSYLIFTIPELIEEISSIMTLEEGDVIATGTPAGVGPLSPGDVVEIEIDGVGVLENPVV